MYFSGVYLEKSLVSESFIGEMNQSDKKERLLTKENRRRKRSDRVQFALVRGTTEIAR
jgi:hypothetical protein